MKPATAMRRGFCLDIGSLMFFGYNTNGFAHHRLEDAVRILAELGYQGVAITLDYHVLNPFSANLSEEIASIRRLLEKFELRSVIETGARFLLDPRRKHQPTLISPDPREQQVRFDFLTSAIEIGHALGSDAVSFWSGTPEDNESYEVHLERLAGHCRRLSDIAAKKQMRLAFEPEPGMLVDTMARYQELHEAVDHDYFGLTIDIGHLHCQGETPIVDYLRQWRPYLWNIHIEDMRRGVHDHLMFGEGDVEFGPIMRTLKEVGYENGVYVELSRHSHNAVETARHSLTYLNTQIDGACDKRSPL